MAEAETEPGAPGAVVHSAAATAGAGLLPPSGAEKELLPDGGGLSPSLGRRLYGPRLTPRLRSLRCPSMHLSWRLYFWHRVHGRWSSQRLHARAQFVH